MESCSGRGWFVKPVRFATIGVGGFARTHLGALDALQEEGLGELVAVSEINVEANREKLDQLSERGLRVYTDYVEMLRTEKSVDVVSIPTGIPMHAPMAIAALKEGCHVLVEKPPAATIQDLDAMIDAQEKSGKLCGVGFQMTSGKGFHHLLQAIHEGRLGKIETVIGIGLWKRLDSYYARNRWAGRLYCDGRWALDGPILNALSHVLNNLFFFVSPNLGEAVAPKWVRAELYKAHPIESEDTSCVLCETGNGVKVFTFFTVCNPESRNLTTRIVGSRGTAVWNRDESIAYSWPGENRQETLSATEAGGGCTTDVFRNFARCVRGEESRLCCPVSETRPYQLAANGAFESSGTVHKVDPEYIIRESEGDSVATTIKDIPDIIGQAIEEQKLFSDLGIPWAEPTETFYLAGYREFPKRFGIS